MEKISISKNTYILHVRALAQKWPSTLVARSEVGQLTGGLIHRRTLANLDSQGHGPSNRFRVGKKVCYPLEDFLSWLEGRIKAA